MAASGTRPRRARQDKPPAVGTRGAGQAEDSASSQGLSHLRLRHHRRVQGERGAGANTGLATLVAQDPQPRRPAVASRSQRRPRRTPVLSRGQSPAMPGLLIPVRRESSRNSS